MDIRSAKRHAKRHEKDIITFSNISNITIMDIRRE